ncbi:MAG: tRNA (adenosine(37)-N6)-threonylcarbamoyltransferase complex ATPase subunit type 1 TsaE [Planctomycetes bacterium]|nr:tRNA (adenosine(37)-N6)-threonylcarbamoyltransferase complex ATPase subunit type 1 TsaE [Planctomycetota bacterium]
MTWSALSRSPAETERLASHFAARLRGGDLVLLSGTYGAGKTCFVRGLCAGLQGDPSKVSSPTFVLLNVYRCRRPLYHYDVVRLRSPHETIGMVLEQTPPEAIAAVEWGERVEGADHLRRWVVHIAWMGRKSRRIVATWHKPMCDNALRSPRARRRGRRD